MYRTCGPWSVSNISQCFSALGCWLWFFHPICLFFLYSPSPPWRSWKMRISLSNSTLLSVLWLQQLWELEESLLLSNTSAPSAKDKEQHVWLWGWGCPAPCELRGPTSGQSTEKWPFYEHRAWGGKFLSFLSLSCDHFSFSPKVIWPNRQRHGWQDWSVPQIYSLSRAAQMTRFLPLENVKIKNSCFTNCK